jgi:amino acid transporter
MATNNKYSVYCRIIWFIMLVVIVLSIISAVKLYQYYQIHPQKEFIINRYNSLPDEALTKIELINNVRYLLAVGLALLAMFFYCDYKAEPDNYWLTKVIKSIKKIKLEE